MKRRIYLLAVTFVLVLIISGTIAYSVYTNLENSKEELQESYNDLVQKYRDFMLTNSAPTPLGSDEHYERIRMYETPRFTNKGDSGWLLFYVTQILHDLGNYTYRQCCEEFNETLGFSCVWRAQSFKAEFSSYLNEFQAVLGASNANASQAEIIYDWVNDFVYYANETGGYGRFPIETLTRRFGDCEDQAMALSMLLEWKGYETVLCMIHDKNLTKEYNNTEGLYHVFCVVKKNSSQYNGTLMQLWEYPEYGADWFVLDPAFNHSFGEDPSWMSNYKLSNGTLSIPRDVFQSLLVDYDACLNRANELGIDLTA